MGRAIGRVGSRVAVVGVSIWGAWLITVFGQAATTCGANPVVCENQLPGDSDYDVEGGGAGDSTIQGFATDISFNTGQPVRFKIATVSDHYRIAIYRLGYYGGAGARKVATLPDFTTPQIQPDCITEPESLPQTGLVDCGNWTVSATWDSTGAASGIYLAKLTRLDVTPNTSSHIPFIIRDDARPAEVLFQTSDTTWQAYNQFGGASLYCGGPLSNAGTSYSCQGRAARVSYNRPIDTRDHDPQSFLFNAEYPMVRWLEANGYDVKYWSGVDTDRRAADLVGTLKPKLFLSVGHDEYWSANQRASVEQARNNGVNLGFFSGNEMYWKTRWEPSIDGARTLYRTLVSYKETMRNEINNDPPDPLDTGANPITTGTWRDTRLGAPGDGGRPENALTGQIWTVNCCSSQIEIPASMRTLRFWRNTRVADLTTGVEFLPNESLGYEWDEVLDNGFGPAGLIRMSLATHAVAEKILDFGVRVGQGTATHSLTLYRHDSGALVFGAGTVQWSWGLDGVHDRGLAAGTHTPDQAMQQATINLFADMDVNPATLQVGADPNRPLVRAVKSTDALGPISTITSPAIGTAVRSGERVTITGTAVDQGGGTVSGVEVSVDGGVTWKAAQGTTSWSFDWSPGALGLMTLRARAIDDSGNIESGGAAATVTIEPGTCPCTSLWHPATVPPIADFNDPTALELGVKFRSDIDGFITGIRYYRSAANTGAHVGNLWTSSGTNLATATFANESATGWQQVLFPAPVPIAANTVYVASYHTTAGHYAATPGYFTTAGTDASPLHALTSGVAGGNGVFLSSGASGFPTQSFNDTNYWVDVVFSPTNNDTTPPLIFDVDEQTIDSANVVITWTTNESANSRVEYSTDIDFPAANTLSVSDAAFVTAHRMPLGHLTPNTTYFYRVSSADRAANTATELAPSFTVPGPTLRDTAQADFGAGQPTLTYAAQTEDGELMLAPAQGAEFSGTSLPDGWRALPWSGGGFARVADGLLEVDGWRVGTCSADATGACTQEAGVYGPGRSLEFVATFSSDGFEHAGFGVTLGSLAEPWAIFSTFTGGGLFARTNTGAVSVDEALGSSYVGAPHRYRIDWHTDGTVSYFIDGARVAAHTAVVNGPMRPVAASDFAVGGGTVKVDWMRMTPYATAGTFLSRVFDATSIVDWHSIQWIADQPAGTSVAISLRTGNTETPDATWSNFAPISAPGTLTQRSRFIQYRAELASSDPAFTPRLEDIIISTSHAPIAQSDHANVAINGSITFPASGPGSLIANDTDADVNDVLRVVGVTQPAHGVALLNADRSVTYAPALNYEGPDSFTYTVSDGLLTGTGTVAIGVGVVNQPPVAQPDAFTVVEDSGKNTLAVLANDSDPEDGTKVTITAVTQAAHGTVAITPGGASIDYTPQADYFGSDSLTYTISDSAGATATATVAITVTPVNDAPAFVKGANQTVLEDAGPQTITAWATAISAGPASEAGQTLTFTATTSNAALFAVQPAIAANGTLTYTTAPDANGFATVTVVLKDNGGTTNGGVDTSAPQTFTITVTPINDPPIAQADTFSTVLNQSLTIAAPGVLGNDRDVDNLTSALSAKLSSSPAHGTVTLAANGGFTYVPEKDFVGADGFTYSAVDPAGATSIVATVTIDVQFKTLSGTTTAGGTVATGTVSADDPVQAAVTTPAPANVTISEGTVSSTTLPTGYAFLNRQVNVTVTNPDGSEVIGSLTSPLTLAFTIDASLIPAGQDPNTLQIFRNDAAVAECAGAAIIPSGSDPCVSKRELLAGGSVRITVITTHASRWGIAIKTASAAPIAQDDSGYFTNFGKGLSVPGPGVLKNDLGRAGMTALIKGQPAGGTVTLSASGGFTFTPSAGFCGSTSFTYTAKDSSNLESNLATATIAVNCPPAAGADTVSVAEDSGATTVSVLANDSDREDGANVKLTSVGQAANGMVAMTTAGTAVTYTPKSNYFGSDTFTYTISDSRGDTAVGTVTVTVRPVNDAPSFTKGADQTVLEDAAARVVTGWATAISAGPANESGQVLTFSVSNTNNALFSVQPQIDARGTLTFTPAPNANGSASVSVSLQDDGGTADGGVNTSATQTFAITVTAVNDAPSFVKGADQISSAGAGAQTVAGWATGISAGPTDESSQTLSFLVTTTSNAALFAVQPAVAPNGTLTYTPAATGGGSAVVTVQLKDNGGTANGGVDTSAAQTFTISLPFTTTTTLSSPTVSPTTYGQAVVLNASVTSAGGTPTGSVDFLDSGLLLGNVALTNGSASLSTTAIGAGTARTITTVYKPTPSFVTSQASLTRAVNKATTTSTFTATPLSVQYSDVVTFDTTLKPGTPGGSALPAQSASFKIGTQVVATVPFVWDATAGVARARFNGPLVEGPTPTGQLKPGSKPISIVYNGVSPNYTVTNRTGSVGINPEDATVAFVGATSLTCGGCTTVPLTAKVTDAADGFPGDIRNATVTFVNRTTGLAISTAIKVAADGTAVFNWPVNLGTATSQTTKIGMLVSGYYTRNNTADDVTIVVTK